MNQEDTVMLKSWCYSYSFLMKFCHTRVVKDLFSGQIITYGRIYSIFDVGFQTRFPSCSLFCRDLNRCTLQSGVSCLGYSNMSNPFASQKPEQKVILHISCIGFKGGKKKLKKQSTKQTLRKLQGRFRFTGFRDLLKESASRIQEQLITACITWHY